MIATLLAHAAGARSMILHGSLAAGGFRPGLSDIDLLAVVDTPLTDIQIHKLDLLIRDADLGEAAGLDLHVITIEVARAPTRTPPVELYIGRHSHDIEISPRVPAEPDLPAELSMARADGQSLLGAMPADVLAPVPAEWVIARGRHWLQVWQTRLDDTAHLTFMRQTAYRIWHFAATGTHCSKPDAVTWAHTHDPALAGADLREVLARVLLETA